ncbi:MAG: tRNA preQ1(34) S-adenosylmethionine ribosyltransferase-isomerase QueA [Alphaproteobacteria bacterium]
MRVDAFDFELPDRLIAARPAEPREAARLLVVEPGRLGDRHVADLPDLLRPGDLLVTNDTKVIPALLFGRRGEARVEATLHRRLGAGRWAALARPAKRLRAGDAVDFGGLAATVEARDGPEVVFDFACDDAALFAALERVGRMPLPPYIRKQRDVDATDANDYQTVFAAHEGAVAAPTAGLHFTPDLLTTLEARGVRRVNVTLHVGAGTFLPVSVEDTDDHEMHTEYAQIDAAAVDAIDAARTAGGRIVAVGTTALRTLESAAADGALKPFAGDTALFITPGFDFQVVDLLLTNFHLPRSTLFMLVAAFAGLERMHAAYAHAIEQSYRFYSFGDATLLHRIDA